MPLFEYRCQKCAHLEEILQKHGDPPPDACPACKKKGTMAKEMSLTSFQLKGGGWYKDLYATPSASSTSDDGSASKVEPPKSDTATKPTDDAAPKKAASTKKPASKSAGSKGKATKKAGKKGKAA